MTVLPLLLLSGLPGAPSSSEPLFRGKSAQPSNYIWRGETQSGDESVVFGGLDYQARGAYAGLWTAPVRGPQAYELDLFAGYRAGPERRWDVGLIRYLYPGPGTDTAEVNGNELIGRDFSEIRLAMTPGRHEIAGYYSPDYRDTGEDQHYLAVKLRFPAGESTLEFHYGVKQGKAIRDGQNRVGDYRLSLIRGH